jgi:uroporphyrinogen decarboxylase
MERTLATLSHKEPDRVPFFLLTTMHGARELGLSIRDYFGSAEHVVKGQIRLQEKFGSDCYYTFHNAAAELEAWGGETLFIPDGPPNAGRPVITRPEEIETIEPPGTGDSPVLTRITDVIRGLKAHAGDRIPIVGVVMSPFSLPVMQMGFEAYLDLLYTDPDRFTILMKKNEQFCVEWANAQLAAGATAICYFDPVSSPTCIPPEMYRKTGYLVAKRTLARITGPTVTHLASGRCLPILEDLASSGTLGVGASALEDIRTIKETCRGRLTVIGNLNGIEMRRWTQVQAETIVKETLACAGPGGGFILSDNHGEIPWQVPDSVLYAIRDAIRTWGNYPLRWVNDAG